MGALPSLPGAAVVNNQDSYNVIHSFIAGSSHAPQSGGMHQEREGQSWNSSHAELCLLSL